MTTPLDPNALYLRLDLVQVGDALVRAALTARQLGHTSVLGTVRDYWGNEGESLEHDFIRDVFVCTPDEIADRWFGGTDNAVRLTAAVLGARQ